jgi:hypothetical protein
MDSANRGKCDDAGKDGGKPIRFRQLADDAREKSMHICLKVTTARKPACLRTEDIAGGQRLQ